ncbi:hypothetical protein ACH470_02455 [Streptomyces bottropensis]|uniref:hypothetical protein n=1 Tax=Streptomyces bottropensis TaxID=42235 RepID=UPI0037A77D1C
MPEPKARRVVVRRGRQWAPLQGSSAEANALAQLLRERTQAAGLTLNELYAKLTPEHFSTHRGLPSRATVGRRLSGERLESDWDVVEAVIDVTSRDQAECETHLTKARELWNKAQHALTQPADDEEEAGETGEGPAKARNLIINGEVHNLSVHYSDNDESSALRQQVIDLQAELLDKHREITDLNERLRHAQLALAAVTREVEETPGASAEQARSRVMELLQNLRETDPAVMTAVATHLRSAF